MRQVVSRGLIVVMLLVTACGPVGASGSGPGQFQNPAGVAACTIAHGGLDAVGEGLAIVMGLTL